MLYIVEVYCAASSEGEYILLEAESDTHLRHVTETCKVIKGYGGTITWNERSEYTHQLRNAGTMADPEFPNDEPFYLSARRINIGESIQIG